MKHRLILDLVWPLVLMLGFGSCGDPDPVSFASDLRPHDVVQTSFYPLTWVAEQLVVDGIEVACILPTGADPAHWQPSREALLDLQRAGLILLNGAGFETWARTASLPRSRVIDTSHGFEERFLRYPGVTHSHGGGAQHTHVGVDGHVWMDPALLREQALAAFQGLRRQWPLHEVALRQRQAKLDEKLKALGRQWDALAPALRKVTLYANHPAYAYLALRLGVQFKIIDLDPETDMEHVDLQELELRPGLMWWEAPPTEKTRLALEKFGVRSVWVSPSESRPAGGADYLQVMEDNQLRLRRALGIDQD